MSRQSHTLTQQRFTGLQAFNMDNTACIACNKRHNALNPCQTNATPANFNRHHSLYQAQNTENNFERALLAKAKQLRESML